MFQKKFFSNKRSAKGFTLVEIIVVSVILAILAAATIPSLLGFIDDAKFKTIDNEARVVRNAAQAYATEQSAKGETDEKITNDINGVINSDHALHYLLQNDANGTVFMTEIKDGKIKKFNYTKEVIDTNEDFISDKVRYVVFDDEKTSLLHATEPLTNINIETFKANIIEAVTKSLTSDDPGSFKSTLTSSLSSSLETSLNSSTDSKIVAAKTSLKTNFKTELGSNVVDLIYPVGSYYVSNSKEKEPDELFPGTTWTQIVDKFLYCASSGAGDTGGSVTHMHTYGIKYSNQCSTSANFYLYNNGSWLSVDHDGNMSSVSINGNANSNVTGSPWKMEATAKTGSSSNMPPYMKVYCWQRTE